MIKWALAAVAVIVVGFVGYLALYLGAFRPVVITEGEVSDFTLLGQVHTGAYHKIVPVIETVEKWAKARNIDCTQSFGLYMDDPRTTEEERLNSFGGCWIDPKQTPPQYPPDFEVRTFKAPLFVKATFDGAPSIGPMKVYPKVESYINDHGYTRLPGTLEVYVIHSPKEMTTTYYFPVNKPAAAAAGQ